MKHILITGMSGTGKSTLSSTLRNKGFNAIDLDEHGDLCWMYYKESGKPVETDFENHNLEWVQTVEWLCNLENLKKLIQDQSETTYYCGSADNVTEMIPLFDAVFLLHVDEATFRKRLSDRKNNDWAQTQEVQDWLIEQRESYEEELISNGAIAVDAAKPTKDIANEIVFKTKAL